MRRILCLFICIMGISFLFSVKSSAMKAPKVLNMQEVSVTKLKCEDESADEIETKYRYHNGKMQYRRWNASRGFWVDDYWIDL